MPLTFGSHCMAEFCMICGTKWKSCNCPWFNYEEVETANPVTYLQAPPDEGYGVPRAGQRARLRRRADLYVPVEADGGQHFREMDRRFQNVYVDNDRGSPSDDHLGFGNGAINHMNERYVRSPNNTVPRQPTHETAAAAAAHAMTASEARRAPRSPRPPFPPFRARSVQGARLSPPPVSRRQSTRDRGAQTAHGRYEREAAMYAPAEEMEEKTRTSLLAGLGASGHGGGRSRVDAWSRYVEPGIEPPEGVISVVQEQ